MPESPYSPPASPVAERAPGTRAELVPGWLRVLCWLVLPGSAIGLTVALVLVAQGGPLWFDLLGLRYEGPARSLPGLGLATFLVIGGAGAYGLLWERSWGVPLSLVAVSTAFAVSLATFIVGFASVSPDRVQVNFRLDLFVSAIVGVRLLRMRGEWRRLPSSRDTAEGQRPSGARINRSPANEPM